MFHNIALKQLLVDLMFINLVYNHFVLGKKEFEVLISIEYSFSFEMK